MRLFIAPPANFARYPLARCLDVVFVSGSPRDELGIGRRECECAVPWSSVRRAGGESDFAYVDAICISS